MFTNNGNESDRQEASSSKTNWKQSSPIRQLSTESQIERDSLEELRENRATPSPSSSRVRSPLPSLKHSCVPVDYYRIPSPTCCCSSIPHFYYQYHGNSNMQMDMAPYCCQLPYDWMRSTLSSCRPPTPRRICHSPINLSKNEIYDDSWRSYRKPCSPNEECEELRDKIRALENDKQNLLLQVNVLTEQIDVQTDKLQEMETELQLKKKQLTNSEDMLQQEIMSRASMENNRLELLTEISSLRLQLATSEQKRLSMEEKFKKLENEIPRRNHLSTRSSEYLSSPSAFTLSGKSSPEPNSEIEKLRRTLESVMEASHEKEKKLVDLQTAVNRYKNLQDVLLGDKSSDMCSRELRSSRDSLLPPSPYNTISSKPPPVPRSIETMRPFSADLFRSSAFKETSIPYGNSIRPYSKTPPPRFHSRPQSFEISSNIQFPSKQILSTNNLEMWEPSQSNISQQSSFPTTQATSYQSLYNPSLDSFSSGGNNKSKFFFRRGMGWLKKGNRSNSTPELAQCETENIYEGISTPTSTYCSSLPPCRTPPPKERRGLRKLFGKTKKNSRLEEKKQKLNLANFRHFGWSPGLAVDTTCEAKEKLTPRRIGVPFSNWDTDTVAEWMDQIGLGMYHGECKKWIRNGDQLLKATNHDLEKELKIKNSLHRKKLRLALQTIGSESRGLDETSGQLDYHWVVGWLDDIGLPQYKDIFAEARVDGRVLYYLTVEDLITLKVTNLLHFNSIKRGIQILRRCKFEPCCLIRRSVPDEKMSIDIITLWTNHRIMEWLKTVDLSEYAPNLRGSGVHGALMVYENGFNSDLLASLLNIPSTKTLLRRHLALRFKELMGIDVMQQKRDSEMKPGFIPLTANSKIKAGRKSHFRLSFRSRPPLNMEDFVCPLETMFNFLDYSSETIPLTTDSNKKDIQDENISPSPVTDTSV